jgi:hypothetical protein
MRKGKRLKSLLSSHSPVYIMAELDARFKDDANEISATETTLNKVALENKLKPFLDHYAKVMRLPRNGISAIQVVSELSFLLRLP